MVTYSFLLSDLKHQDVDAIRLQEEIRAVPELSVPLVAVNVDSTTCQLIFEAHLSDSENSAVRAVVLAHDMIATWKKRKCDQIDLHTDDLINSGFEFIGHKYSMSIEAQSRMLGMYQLRNEPLMVYPVSWNSLEDDYEIQIVNAQMVSGFFMTAVGTYRAYIDSGTQLKAAVRAATTKQEIDVIVDPR